MKYSNIFPEYGYFGSEYFCDREQEKVYLNCFCQSKLMQYFCDREQEKETMIDAHLTRL